MESNATELDLSDDENSNGGGDSIDEDARNSINQRDNDEEELEPYRLEKLLLCDIDHELTEHHAGADGDLAQLIKMKQEARKSVRNMGSKLPHPHKHKNLTEVNGESSFSFI